MNKKLKSEAKRVESRERREKLYKKDFADLEAMWAYMKQPEKKSANRYEKQVTKLMRLNLDVSVRCGR